MDEDPKDEAAADLLAFALGARPERVTDALVAYEPALASALPQVREDLAALALALAPAPAPPGLRQRILRSVSARARPARPALVVLDMMVDHLRPGGGGEVPRARAIVPDLRARIEAARAASMPVVYVVDVHEAWDTDTDLIDGWGAHNLAGTDGAEVWPELAPIPGDPVIAKSTYNAFTGSRLGEVLDELRVDELILTGCLTELGIMATATAGFEKGFAVTVPRELQAGAHEALERAALTAIALMAPYGPARAARLRAFAEAP